jgi:hypothetical protein
MAKLPFFDSVIDFLFPSEDPKLELTDSELQMIEEVLRRRLNEMSAKSFEMNLMKHKTNGVWDSSQTQEFFRKYDRHRAQYKKLSGLQRKLRVLIRS